MVYDFLNSLLDIPFNLFSEFVGLPAIGPFLNTEYAGIIFFGLFLMTVLMSKFLKFRYISPLIILTSFTGLILGDIYVAFFSFVLLIVLFFAIKTLKLYEKLFGFLKFVVVRIVKKKEDEPDENKKEPFESEGSKENFDEAGSKENFDEVGSKMSTNQKICPYCNSPLKFIPQYQRYFCYSCQKYV